MGLDQYAISREVDKNGNVLVESENDTKPLDTTKELCEWRKHPYLQKFMDTLFCQKGLVSKCDNGLKESHEMNSPDELELTISDIEKFRESILMDSLPEGGGFFWGDDSSTDYKQQDLEFCDNAIEEIKNGKKVYYSCWW